MVFKHFRLIIVGRVLLLCGLIGLFYYLILYTHYYAATFITGCLVIYQIAMLIQYVESTNRDLARFLAAIRYSDFSQTFAPTGLGSSFDQLKGAFNDVISRFQAARAEKEESLRYLQTVVQHVGVGLIAFDENGEVTLYNSAAKRLLAQPRLKNIRALAPRHEALVETLGSLSAGKKALLKIARERDEVQLSVHATEFVLQGRQFTLVSLQNIGSELAETEMEAWQKLIRVLTHEIMNSVTPISSLAASANSLLNDSVAATGASPAAFRDIQAALATIENRSQGLLNFVNAYRNLTRIPRPNLRIFSLKEMFAQLYVLMAGQLAENRVDFQVKVRPASLELTADPELIEQILINLLSNALHAVAGRKQPKIQLTAGLDERGHVLVEVADNGAGMSREVQENIFIPFYTTKKGGSGIGLSLSRQIMRLHRGSISVQSEPGVGTVFTLRF